MASTFVPPRPDQWEPNSAPSQEAKPFVPPRPDQWEAPVGRVRTPKETEAVLRSRYPEAYKPTRSVTEQVLRGVGKTVGRDIHEGLTNMVDPYGGVRAIRDIANGSPRPPSAFEQATEPQGPGEEAGQIFTRGAEALATVPRALGSAITEGANAIRGWQQGRAVSKAVQAERIRRMAKEALDGPPQPPTVTPRRVAPPPQTGSNNRTPLPAPPVTAAPPALQGSNAPPLPPQAKPVTANPPPIQGSNAPPLPPARTQVGAPPLTGSNAPPQPPPRPQVSAPPLQGSNAAPAPPRPQASAPPLQGSNNRTPVPTGETGPPIPPASTPQAGPPPPAVAPQSGPPQPPQTAPESGTAYAAPEGSSPNYTAPKEHYMQAARTVRGKAIGRLFRDEGTSLESFSSWKVGDPRWKQAAADAGVTPPNSPESIQAIINEFGKLPPRKVSGTPRMATGGVIVPAGKERVRGMAHRWGPKGRR